MKYVNLTLFILLISLTFILLPSFAVISSSQSNDTSSDNKLSNETETFSSMSHSFGENQSQGQSKSSNDKGN